MAGGARYDAFDHTPYKAVASTYGMLNRKSVITESLLLHSFPSLVDCLSINGRTLEGVMVLLTHIASKD